MKIISIYGKRGVGKTTLAKYLGAKHGYNVVSFADKLRAHCVAVWGKEFLDVGKESPFRSYPWMPREFMVDYGNLIRKYDSDYWVDGLLSSLDKDGNYIVDDMRFPNEYHKLTDLGAIFIRLDRFVSLNVYKDSNPALGESEHHIQVFRPDYVVGGEANTTLESLYLAGDRIYEKIKD